MNFGLVALILRKLVVLYNVNLVCIYLRSSWVLQQTRRCLDDGFYLSKDYICSSACAIFGLKDCVLVDWGNAPPGASRAALPCAAAIASRMVGLPLQCVAVARVFDTILWVPSQLISTWQRRQIRTLALAHQTFVQLSRHFFKVFVQVLLSPCTPRLSKAVFKSSFP